MPMVAPADSRLVLPTRLDTAAARPLHATLQGKRGRDLDLDAGGVEQLGGLCLQVLLAAAVAWQQEGLTFGVNNVSPAMQAGLKVFGVTSFAPPFSEGSAA